MKPNVFSSSPSTPLPLCNNSHANIPAKNNAQQLPIPASSNVSNIKNGKSIYPLSLLRTYTKAGQMVAAHKVFDELPNKTLVDWTNLMSGYERRGHPFKVLFLLHDLITQQFDANSSLWPDPFVFSVALKACASLRNLNLSRELHCLVIKFCTSEDLYVCNGLISTYATCNYITYSERVFNDLSQPDLVSWACILDAYVKNKDYDGALNLFIEMAWSGTPFDAFALSIGLKAASYNLLDNKPGFQIHGYMIKMGFGPSPFLENCLLEFYGRVGELDSMRKVFDKMPERNLVTWNTAIECYTCNRHYEKALLLFHELMSEESKCDLCTLGSTLQAVISLGELKPGKQIHAYVIKAGFGSNSHIVTAILDMYMILAEDNSSIKALKDFMSNGAEEMDEFMISNSLKSCASQMDLDTGKTIHGLIFKLGMSNDLYIKSSLMDMYAKCTDLDSTYEIFSRIERPDLVSWSLLISGHCSNFNFEKALELFRDMQFRGVKANEYIYTSVLLACIGLGDFNKGREIHCDIIKNGHGSNLEIVRLLVKVYRIMKRPLECENLRSFMQKENLKLFLETVRNNNETVQIETLCAAMNSCGQLMLLNLGLQIHGYITTSGFSYDYNINNSLINMYSNFGNLNDAYKVFDEMPKKSSHSWTLIIHASVQNGSPTKALELFVQMLRNDKGPNSNTFLYVLRACVDLGSVDFAFQVFESMEKLYDVKPIWTHHSCIVKVLEKAGMSEESMHFVDSVMSVRNSEYSSFD